MSQATFVNYLLKGLVISFGLVKDLPLSIIVDGDMLGDSFKEIYVFIPFHVVFK